MNIEQLQYFILIHQLGSINKAAQQTMSSPQTISAAIKKLEEELGCTLFNRNGKKNLTLSEYGTVFLKTSDDILNSFYEGLAKLQAVQEIQVKKRNTTNEILNIAISPAHGISIVPPAIEQFSKLYPHTTLKVMQQETSEIEKLVPAGDCLGICISFATLVFDKDIICHPLSTDKLYTIVTPNHPLAKYKNISIKTVLKYPLAILQSDYSHSNPLCAVLEQYGKPNYYTITNNYQIYQNVIKNSRAVGFINKSALKTNTALAEIRNDIVTFPIRNFPAFTTYAVTTTAYLEQHKQSIEAFLNIYHSLL